MIIQPKLSWPGADGSAERTDAVVVGGGLAGLSGAWALRRRHVIVLEQAQQVGGRLHSEPHGIIG
jgi:phytoene dehydrogenase-like protein